MPGGIVTTIRNTGGNAGQIRSPGPDKDLNITSDNIVFPADLPVGTTGTLVVHVLVNDIPQPTGLTVEVFTTDSTGEQVKRAGTDGTQTTAAQGSTPFRFTVPHGVSVIKATHLSAGVTVTRTVNVEGGGQHAGGEADYYEDHSYRRNVSIGR